MPCTKGMTGCAALCGHRAHVEGYRAERARQWSDVIEFTKGYDTEVADRLRELRENGTPLIDYKTWLKQSARPPEDRDMPISDATLSPLHGQGYSDPAAEQILLASVMENPQHAHIIAGLKDWEFSEPLHQVVFRGIRDLDDQGIEPAASTVENWLRENNVLAPSPAWDSRFYRPNRPGDSVPVLKAGETQWHDRRDLGLRGWHQLVPSGSIESIDYFAEFVRDRTILRLTAEAHTTAAATLAEIAATSHTCDIGKHTSDAMWKFQERVESIPLGWRVENPLPPQKRPAPIDSTKYAQAPAQTAAVSAAAAVRVKVG